MIRFMERSTKKILVFGVFDGLHDGHRAFLRQAQKLGELIVVVAQDATVESIKHRRPEYSLGHRIAEVKDAGYADIIVAGDLIQHSWNAIKRYEPDIVAIGYDQKDLRDALMVHHDDSSHEYEIIELDPYNPESQHSSIIRKKKEETDKGQHAQFFEQRMKQKRKRFDKGEYVADFVYGANDGIITTFAVVTGAVGASLSPGIVVILGIANLLADGFSMGASAFLSMMSERNFHKTLKDEQQHDTENNPDIAKEEVRHVLRQWDAPTGVIEPMTLSITRSKRRWIDFVLREEYGITPEDTSNPGRHSLATFVAFVIAGTLPIVPYIFGIAAHRQFLVSIIATACALFIAGAAQSLLTTKKWWWKTGLQMLVVGGVAAGISYGLGFLVRSVFGVVV